MKRIAIYIYVVFIFSCKTNINNVSEVRSNNNDYKEYKGLIFRNSFINKIGEPNPEVKDYYFRYHDRNYYIKLSECPYDGNISVFDNAFVRIYGALRYGSWDSDDPKVQSRVGDYVVFSEIQTVILPLSFKFYDGNNNLYIVERNRLQYIPVIVNESSSGIYSGGAEKELQFSVYEYAELFFRAEKIFGTGEYATLERTKGTWSFLITYNDKIEQYFVVDSEALQMFKTYTDELFNRNR